MTLGVKLWDKLLSELVQQGILEQFKSILGSFTKKRNDAAHKNISSMKTYDSPSIILNNFAIIKPIIEYIDTYIGAL